MKQLFITFFIMTGFLLFVAGAKAASPTTVPSPTQNINGIEAQINSLKDRIASRVAQLKLVDKRGIIGKVTDVSETQITITDSNGNIRFVDVDELTKFSSHSAKASFGISDITKNSIVGVLGLYNKESRRILARFVDVLIMPDTIHGAVVSLDSKNYMITIVKSDNKTLLIDVPNTARTTSFAKDGGLEKSGFSKITAGERITVTGFYDLKDKNKLVATRIIIYPDLPINPSIDLNRIGLSTDDITPSTGSGKKLIPIIK